MRVTLAAGRRRHVHLDLDDPSDHISARIITRGAWYEKDLLDDIATRVRPGGVAIDVGAHIGNHALWMAAACGLNVVAIEPNRLTRAQLERNVTLNKLGRRIRVIGAAAGAAPGRARIEPVNPANTGMSRAINDPAGGVDVITVDSLGLTDVTVMKVDVEGAELSILRGAAATIARCRPVLYIEAVDTLDEVERFLAPYGYQRFGRYAITPTYGFAVPATAASRVSVAVMAHTKRRAFVPELVQALDRPAQVVWDRHDDRWDTGRRSMLAFDPTATHHLVIQDDAVVCRDLVAGVEAALEHVPSGTPLCLYSGRHRIFRTMVSQLAGPDTSWLSMASMEWGVGIVMPTRLIQPMITWADKQGHVRNYDMRVGMWCASQGIRIWYPWPSLLDHRYTPSLVAGRKAGRRALNFIGDAASALDQTWDGETVTIPTFRRVAQSRAVRAVRAASPAPGVPARGRTRRVPRQWQRPNA